MVGHCRSLWHTLYVHYFLLDGYTTDDITYVWKDNDPVQIPEGLSLPRFSIEKYSSSYCNVKTNTGEFIAIQS